MSQFEVKTTTEPDRVVVTLSGECDLAVRDELEAALREAVQRSPVVMIDLGSLTFMDSSGIHGLVTAHHAALERGGRVLLRRAHGVVADVLTLTGVSELLRSQDGRHDA
jgi:anti-sigma B factor antagonist